MRDAGAGDAMGRPGGDVVTAEDDGAGGRTHAAAYRHQQRRLACAIGADQRDDLAFAYLQRYAAQRLDVAVEGVDAADGQHIASAWSSPRYARITSGSSRTCAGCPSAIFRPYSSTI